MAVDREQIALNTLYRKTVTEQQQRESAGYGDSYHAGFLQVSVMSQAEVLPRPPLPHSSRWLSLSFIRKGVHCCHLLGLGGPGGGCALLRCFTGGCVVGVSGPHIRK
eukprot:3375602-Rhodomonas_salina.2